MQKDIKYMQYYFYMEKYINYEVKKKKLQLSENDTFYVLNEKYRIGRKKQANIYIFIELQRAVGFAYKLAKKSGFFEKNGHLEYSMKGEYRNLIGDIYINKHLLQNDNLDGYFYSHKNIIG